MSETSVKPGKYTTEFLGTMATTLAGVGLSVWDLARDVAPVAIDAAARGATETVQGRSWWGGILAAAIAQLGYALSRAITKRG